MKKLSTALLIALFLLGSYFVNRVHVDIVIISDSSGADLDLHVYIRDDRQLSASYGDDGEKVCRAEITESDYMTIKAVRRGKSADGFWLIII